MITIKTPETAQEWEAYYDLRYRILRAPLNQLRGSERNEGDATGIHFALYEHESLIAVARLDKLNHNVFQARWVAVENNQQGKGFGKLIMEAMEAKVVASGGKSIMLQSRDYAVDFYLKLGYTVIAPSFKLFDVLQHFEMNKELF
jgi:predicted GNAT family N-acyltransferase